MLVPTLIAPDPSAEADARKLLDRVGLSARLDHRPAELSGGERQRAAIARALIRKPKLLLADEPTGNLDRKTAQAIGELLSELHRQDGTMLVVVTHSPELAKLFPRRAEMATAAWMSGREISRPVLDLMQPTPRVPRRPGYSRTNPDRRSRKVRSERTAGLIVRLLLSGRERGRGPVLSGPGARFLDPFSTCS